MLSLLNIGAHESPFSTIIHASYAYCTPELNPDFVVRPSSSLCWLIRILCLVSNS